MLNHVHTCGKVFIALKAEVDKLDIYKLVNVLMV